MNRVVTFIAVLGVALFCGSFFVPTRGLIEGRATYPACIPPADLEVCAEKVDARDRICTTDFAWTPEGAAFLMDVPAGTWLVYATAKTDLPGVRAYYSRAVVCGLGVECEDHTPIPVEVRAGGIVSDVRPSDWYTPWPGAPPPDPEPTGRPVT
jgi:hypothetical protein